MSHGVRYKVMGSGRSALHTLLHHCACVMASLTGVVPRCPIFAPSLNNQRSSVWRSAALQQSRSRAVKQTLSVRAQTGSLLPPSCITTVTLLADVPFDTQKYATLSSFAVEAPSRTAESSSASTSGSAPSYVSLSDKYAIVDAAGTQLLLEEGRWYTCNRLQV